MQNKVAVEESARKCETTCERGAENAENILRLALMIIPTTRSLLSILLRALCSSHDRPSSCHDKHQTALTTRESSAWQRQKTRCCEILILDSSFSLMKFRSLNDSTDL